LSSGLRLGGAKYDFRVLIRLDITLEYSKDAGAGRGNPCGAEALAPYECPKHHPGRTLILMDRSLSYQRPSTEAKAYLFEIVYTVNALRSSFGRAMLAITWPPEWR